MTGIKVRISSFVTKKIEILFNFVSQNILCLNDKKIYLSVRFHIIKIKNQSNLSSFTSKIKVKLRIL
jgi:hypothetical protein